MKQKPAIPRMLLLALLTFSLVALFALPALASSAEDEDGIEYFEGTLDSIPDGTPEEVSADDGSQAEAVPAVPPSGDSSQAQLEPVTDLMGLLSSEQVAQLTELARSQESETGCALYVVAVDDYSRYIEVGDAYDCATAIYTTYDLGWGADRDGALLLLSMNDRDYALTVHGSRASALLDTEAQVWLEDEFLPYFAQNDWYNGFRVFMEDSGYVLLGNEPLISATGDYDYADGYDYGVERSGGFLGAVRERLPFMSLFSLLIAFISTLVMKGKMKSVSRKAEARRYLTGPAELSVNEDRYTHQTESRRVVESNSSNRTRGGGISHSGGGFSGRSGKF